MMKYFDKKQLFAKNTQTTSTDVKGSIIKDLETLNTIYYADMEKLMFDKEKLGLKSNTDELGYWVQNDIEKLSLHWDTEKLGTGFTVSDAEKLGAGHVVAFDAEKLGAGFTDAEKLGTGFTDAEKLSGSLLFDSEKLGFWDNEKLSSISPYIN